MTRTGGRDGSGFGSKTFAPLLWWRWLDFSGVRFRAKDLPRSLVLGNGNSLIGFDATYSVRDIYYPRVGDANHTMGNVCRTGFFIDGRFAWLDDPAWERKFGYAEDSLVSDVRLSHPGLGISVRFEDFVDLARNWFIRNVEVTSQAGFSVGRVFFHYDWFIEGSDIGNTVLYEPRHRGRTLTYGQVWAEKDHRHIDDDLGKPATDLYRRSVLTARTHVDNRGAIIASTDFDITKFARDTYAYAWPRDGALVANALDRAGHEDVTRQFFTFCQQSLVEEGYFLHKYTPYGQPGSSWLPWIDSHGVRTLPVQEDETGLVLWSLWQHYRIHQNLDFMVGLYTALVVPAADWIVS